MNTKIIAKNLVCLRQSRNWTQEDMADKLHVSRQAISKWETGASLPNLNFLLKLSQLYNITINEILEPPTGNHISGFEEIVYIDKSKLIGTLSSFKTSEIVKASMGASPTINDLLKQIFNNIDFVKERITIGTVKINEIEDIHNRIISMINMGL